MIEAWRYTCGRCGSVSVRKHIYGISWKCAGGSHATPAVYDLKQNEWCHAAQDEQETGPVPSSGQSL